MNSQVTETSLAQHLDEASPAQSCTGPSDGVPTPMLHGSGEQKHVHEYDNLIWRSLRAGFPVTIETVTFTSAGTHRVTVHLSCRPSAGETRRRWFQNLLKLWLAVWRSGWFGTLPDWLSLLLKIM
jgi:hypothetical protein